MDAKRRIHKFNFDVPTLKSGQKTHVALVDRAANLTEALIIKQERYETTSQRVVEYDENGDRTETERTQRVEDYGEDLVYVTDTEYRVVSTTVPRVQII